jgi:hypothetical protein
MLTTTALATFIEVNRDELIRRCQAKVAKRSDPPPTASEIDHGVPMFLGQMVDQLKDLSPNTVAIRAVAVQHGRDLFFEGLTVEQVVHDYGDVCQSVTELATELTLPISTEDFRTLNRCLDDAIAGAVAEFARQERFVATKQSVSHSVELQNLLYTAITAFEALQTGSVGIGGNTATLVHRRLVAMRSLI